MDAKSWSSHKPSNKAHLSWPIIKLQTKNLWGSTQLFWKYFWKSLHLIIQHMSNVAGRGRLQSIVCFYAVIFIGSLRNRHTCTLTAPCYSSTVASLTPSSVTVKQCICFWPTSRDINGFIPKTQWLWANAHNMILKWKHWNHTHSLQMLLYVFFCLLIYFLQPFMTHVKSIPTKLNAAHQTAALLYIHQCPIKHRAITNWSKRWAGKLDGWRKSEWDHLMRVNVCTAESREDRESRREGEIKGNIASGKEKGSYRLNDAWFPGYLGCLWGTYSCCLALTIWEASEGNKWERERHWIRRMNTLFLSGADWREESFKHDPIKSPCADAGK